MGRLFWIGWVGGTNLITQDLKNREPFPAEVRVRGGYDYRRMVKEIQPYWLQR